MKISLWMIAERLTAYDPKYQIHEGKRILQNVRILSDNTKMSPYTVYLSQLSENRIALLNGVDIVYVTCDDIHQLLDEVLDVFEMFNEWRNGISEMINSSCAISEIFREFSKIQNRYYILADASYYVLEQFCKESFFLKNSKAQKVLQDRIMPVDILMKINQHPHVRMAEQPSYLVALPELDNVSCVTNLFVNHVHHGWLITLNDTNHFSQGSRDLQDEMGSIVSRWLAANENYEKNMQKSGIFLDIMEHSYDSTELILHRLEGFSWYKNDRKAVYTIRQTSAGTEQTRVLDRFLQHVLPYAFTFRFQNRLILLANWELTGEASLEENLAPILKKYKCIAGKSPCFSDIFLLKKSVELADMAAEYGPAEQPIRRIEDSQLRYLLHVLETSSVISIAHPVLKQLQEYDKKHSSDYYLSLSAFLGEERNYQRTAERLHIHRSTLIYRISKILEMTGLDLEDADVRLHLLLSFKAEEEAKE